MPRAFQFGDLGASLNSPTVVTPVALPAGSPKRKERDAGEGEVGSPLKKEARS